MELNPVTSLEWLDWDIISRLGVAAILGLVLGLDREWRGHAAGMRTHGLICVSAAAMVVSIMALYHQLDGPRMDPLRLFEAAGAFIGIIGAGLIVFSKGQLHNLTTAAHLWLATMVGIACGAAQWPLVAILTVVSLIMITVLRVAEDKFGKEDRNIARDRKVPRRIGIRAGPRMSVRAFRTGHRALFRSPCSGSRQITSLVCRR